MRKLLVTLVLAFFSYVVMNAQPSVHFGFNMLETISEETLISTMSKYGTRVDLSHIEDDGVMNSYMFSDVSYEGRTYDYAYLGTLKDGALVYVGYLYKSDPNSEKKNLVDTYNAIADTLNVKYNMVEQEVEDPSMVRLVDSSSHTYVILDKITDGDDIVTIELAYVMQSMITLKRLAKALEDMPELPDIQDTFFGMTLGDKYTSTQIKNALASKGTYASQQNEGNGYSYTFTDVRFAGSTWDFATILTTQRNELYYFSVYDTWPDGYSNDDERNEAKRNFDSFKARLDEKYGEVEVKSEDGGESAMYMGGNNIVLQISNRRSQSAGGTFRRYFELLYVQKEILSQVNESYDDEL